ncbi:hypothetical protein XFF6992_20028 [Xanthomonas citri pv. fuscans]|nr:hypothetical protein XFF6992_20028 [Xanthomonas citri pv. fuscans]SOO33566.1 hypothetical protein XFF6994_30008 [Xanthomonas citri pv. fuscans]
MDDSRQMRCRAVRPAVDSRRWRWRDLRDGDAASGHLFAHTTVSVVHAAGYAVSGGVCQDTRPDTLATPA